MHNYFYFALFSENYYPDEVSFFSKKYHGGVKEL